MLTTFCQSHKTLVQAQHQDYPLGTLIDIVVNPSNGVFEVFWIHTPEGKKLLLPKDIIFWNQEKITISDANDLTEPEALPRMNKIFEQECPLLKNNVWDKSTQTNYGQVSDFMFDTLSPRLLGLEVKQGFLGLHTLRIPQHHIVHIQADRITIDQSLMKHEGNKPLERREKITPLKVPELERSSSRKQ